MPQHDGKKAITDGFETQNNSYKDYYDAINIEVGNITSKLFSQGIIDEIAEEDLKRYFSNPDLYQKELQNASEYFYVSKGEVFQLFDLSRTLPSLNTKIQSFDKDKNDQYARHLATCNKIMHKVKHRSLTRDIITQATVSGTFIGIWLGTNKKPFFYSFEDLDSVFPAFRMNGDWVVALDLDWVDKMSDIQQRAFFENMGSIVTEKMLAKYKSDRKKENQYVYLPQNKTCVIRTHHLSRNQARGLGWATQGLYDLMHKKKMKDLEKAVANKIINAIAVLTIGDKNDKEYRSLQLPKGTKRKVHIGVKQALEASESKGISLISLPEFAELVFPEVKFGDALEPDKFESVNSDIQSSFGLSQAIMNGSGGNFASAKMNLDIFYKKIAVLLEEIETEVYGKLFNMILPANQSDNFYLVYDKEVPMSSKEKVDYLMKLHTQEGFSLKHVIDNIPDVDFEDYVSQSIYEQKDLELQVKIQPYQSAYTSSSEDIQSGNTDNPQNENTEKSLDSDGNSLPES